MTILQLTKAFISCSRCPEDFGNGEGLKRCDPDAVWRHSWIPPRGWAGSPVAAHCPVFIVALNPGHPIARELETYSRAGIRPYVSAEDVPDSHASAVLGFVTSTYTRWTQGPNSVYGRKCIAYARCVAWILRRLRPTDYTFDPETSDWRDFAWITDAFKCSTRSDSNPKIPPELMLRCVTLNLRREIDALKPLLVLALGNDSYKALSASGVSPIVKVRHASNGCPRIDSNKLNPNLEAIAMTLGSRNPETLIRQQEFTGFRGRLQQALFPCRRARPTYVTGD